MEQDRIIVGKGIWMQAEEANKISHLAKDIEDTLMWGSAEVERKKLETKTLILLYSVEDSGVFTSSEFENLITMIKSKDIESIQLAATLIETKIK